MPNLKLTDFTLKTSRLAFNIKLKCPFAIFNFKSNKSRHSIRPTTTSSSACIATKLDSATIKVIKFDGHYDSEGKKWDFPGDFIEDSRGEGRYSWEGNRWELLEEIPIKWKTK